MTNAALTPNQLVAYNLARARNLRGWTQQEASQKLEQWLGARWSKASWSAAERSVDGLRRREFTTDEIVAFSQTFGLPIAWWFLPPGPDRPDLGGPEQQGTIVGAQIGYDGGQEAFESRLAELLTWLGIPGTQPERIMNNIVDQIVDRSVIDERDRIAETLISLGAALKQTNPEED